MYLNFQMLCDGQTQLRLHKALRPKVQNWKKQGLIERAVLTYHTAKPPHNLYVCLDIRGVNEPEVREREVSAEVIKQVPAQIMDGLRKLGEEHKATMQITNYALAVEAGRQAYGNASTSDILNFASVGTEIALEIMDKLKRQSDAWRTDMELAWFIRSRLEEKLGRTSPYLDMGRHFVCSPLLIPDMYIAIPIRDRALRIIRCERAESP